MKLTPEQLREIAERAEESTPGPWVKSELYNDGRILAEQGYITSGVIRLSDSDFIAASRTDIPRLLNHIKALEEENDHLRKLIHNVAIALTQTQSRLKDDDEMLCEGSYGAYITEYTFSRSDLAQMLQEKGANNQ